mgnify:CR=1 FL=1
MDKICKVHTQILARALLWFFERLYTRLAWAYDMVAWLASAGRWNRWGLSVRADIEGPCVLEIGHGPGHLLKALASDQYAAFGIDLSPQMVRLTRRRLLRAGLPLRHTRAKAQTLPFPAVHFDTVVSTFPAPYITDPATLQEIYRVLRPGGKLLILHSAHPLGHRPPERLARFALSIGRSPQPSKNLLMQMDAKFQQAGFIGQTDWLLVPPDKVLIYSGRRPS